VAHLPAGPDPPEGCHHGAVNWVVGVPRVALARDIALAAILAGAGMITAGGAVPALLAVGAALALAARRVWPLPVALVIATATAVYLLRGYPYGFILVSFAVAVYTAALLLPPRRAVLVGAFALAALLAHVIALGHGLAAITMQADIALHMLPSRPEQAPIALAEIRSAGRAALDELRATLSTVREEPTPGVAGLADLVKRISGTGLEVTLSVADTVRSLPEAVDRTVYRIVQEALTTVLRRPGVSPPTRVSLRCASSC
jgi:hypothetical protein